MFDNISKSISASLEELDTLDIPVYKDTTLKKRKDDIIYPLNKGSKLSYGTESFSGIQYGREAVETPSGEPKGTGISTIVELSTRLNNVPYCPIAVLGKNSKGGYVFDAKLSGVIEDVVDYLDLLECLSTMRENDELTITIDSPGGFVHSGTLICTHILACRGTVRTRAVGLCASAGSLIWSAGHICEVESTALLMWHMSSHQDMGNSLSIYNEAGLQVEFVKNVLLEASVAKGHITREEVDDICNNPNKNKYITAQEMQRRLDAHASSSQNVEGGE